MPEIRAISEHEVRKSLTVMLRETHDDPGTAAQRAESFQVLADKKKLDLNRQLVVSENGEIVFSCFLMPHDGGSAFVFFSSLNGLMPESRAMAEIMLRRLVRSARNEYKFLQLMIEPEDTERRALAAKVGFVFGSEILYMYRQIHTRVGAVRIPPQVNWQLYNERNHDIFADVIERTWYSSKDCPFMGSLRTVEECIAGYKASASNFDKSHWSLMLIDRAPAGVCLLSPLLARDSIELTYTGVVPEFRGRGLGKVMLNRAVALSSIDGFKVMTLAVDTQNHHARKVYVDVGFKDMFSRLAYYYSTRDSSDDDIHAGSDHDTAGTK